jgi:hypothetical protein
MVVMGVDEIRVDLLSLGDFGKLLGPRTSQVRAKLSALTFADPPALGTFHDGQQTVERYWTLRDQFLARLSRLLDALDAAQAGTTAIAATYRTAEELNVATTKAVDDLLKGTELPGDGVPA